MGTWNLGPFDNDSASDFLGNMLDTLDGALLDLERSRTDDTAEGHLLRFAYFERARAAVAILVALLKSGVAWSKADDSPTPERWLATLQGFVAQYAQPEQALLVQAVSRELEELAELARSPRPRRPMPREGTLERYFREQRLPRDICEWAHQFGDDAKAAWAACPDPGRLVLFAAAFGVTAQQVFRAVATVLHAHVEGLADDGSGVKALLLSTFATLSAGGRIQSGASSVQAQLREARQKSPLFGAFTSPASLLALTEAPDSQTASHLAIRMQQALRALGEDSATSALRSALLTYVDVTKFDLSSRA